LKISKNSTTDRIGVSIVEEQFSSCGYIFREQPIVDCGIDAQIETVDGDNATGSLIALQIKSGRSWFKEEVDNDYIFRGDNDHLSYWLDHSLPVLIILCNTESRECFWQSITKDNIVKTKKAWKISIPKTQKINAGIVTDLKKLVNKIPISKNFSIASTDDVSHSAAKRYSLRIILNKEHTQSEIIELIKKQTIEAVQCDYHRNNLVRTKWGNKPAHVVYLFIYTSSEDEKNNNYLCRTQWISKDLCKEFSPMPIGGEEIYENLYVDWNNSYLEMAKFHTSNSMSKEQFLLISESVISRMKPIIVNVQNIIYRYKSHDLSFSKLKRIMNTMVDEVDDINNFVNSSKLPTYECSDADEELSSIICNAHNIFIPFIFNKNLDDEKHIIFNIESQLKYYQEKLPELFFVLKKLK